MEITTMLILSNGCQRFEKDEKKAFDQILGLIKSFFNENKENIECMTRIPKDFSLLTKEMQSKSLSHILTEFPEAFCDPPIEDGHNPSQTTIDYVNVCCSFRPNESNDLEDYAFCFGYIEKQDFNNKDSKIQLAFKGYLTYNIPFLNNLNKEMVSIGLYEGIIDEDADLNVVELFDIYLNSELYGLQNFKVLLPSKLALSLLYQSQSFVSINSIIKHVFRGSQVNFP